MEGYAGPGLFIPEQSLSGIMAILPDRQNNRNDVTLITSLHALNMAETAILLVESDILRFLAGLTENQN